MRKPPEEFTRGPKATVNKLNALVRSVRKNIVIPGVGLRIRETDKGTLLTLDERILVQAGLANSGQFGRGPDNGGQPFGAGDAGVNFPGFTPVPSDPTEPDPDPQPDLPDGVTPGDGTDGFGGGTSGSTRFLRLATFNFPEAEINEFYSVSLQATGGEGNYQWDIIEGSLPAGLTLDGNTISGTPTEEGVSEFRVRVRSGDQERSALFTIEVTDEDSVKLVGTKSLGTVYWLDEVTLSTTLSVTGGTSPYAVLITSNTLFYWFSSTITGTNVPRPPSLSSFSESSIYDSGVQLSVVNIGHPNSRVIVPPGVDVSEYRLVKWTPIGVRKLTVFAYDTAGSFTFANVTVDIQWDTSRYIAVKTGPGSASNYPRWIDKSTYENDPSLYTLLPDNEIPRV